MTMTSMRSRAFSLIEVMISVVVLALGLLGLAAVFPVVVAQQRQATDTVQGISMERSIAEYLEGQGALRQQPASGANLAVPANRRGWRILTAEQTWSEEGEWNTPQPLGGGGLEYEPEGNLLVDGPNAASSLYIPMHERMFPKPYTGGSEPRYVWDMAARRVQTGNSATHLDDSLQVAVFVRRVDASIRIPRGRTLSDVLSNNLYSTPALPINELRLPVAVDADGRPTGDGQGFYSPVSTFVYTVVEPVGETVEGEAARFIVPDPTLTRLQPYFYQIGQKFVDQLGTVHEVVEIERGRDTAAPMNPPALRLEPPLSRDVVRLGQATGEDLYMLYTPQVPVSVTVKTIRP